jgi:hypothetical protein
LNEAESVVSYLGNELDTLRVASMVDRSLDDAAAMTVSGDFDTVGTDGVVNELVVFRGQMVETFLDDVVSVQVLDERDDVEVEGEDQVLDLSLSREQVDHLLDRSSSVHVERNGYEFSRQTLDQSVPLFVAAKLEQLLREVVAKSVRHELPKVWEDLGEDHVAVFRVVLFEFLLEEAATMLVFAQGGHVCCTVSGHASQHQGSNNGGTRRTALEVLEPQTSESVRLGLSLRFNHVHAVRLVRAVRLAEVRVVTGEAWRTVVEDAATRRTRGTVGTWETAG